MMGNLILTRRCGEAIEITVGDETIIMTVVDIRGSQARLAFKANHDVVIDRMEIADRKRLGLEVSGNV